MDSQKRIVFTAALLSAVIYAALAGSLSLAVQGSLSRNTAYVVTAILCVTLPLIGVGISRLRPTLKDYANGLALSPFPGAIAFLLAGFWMSLT